jgi:hypothetical protein
MSKMYPAVGKSRQPKSEVSPNFIVSRLYYIFPFMDKVAKFMSHQSPAAPLLCISVCSKNGSKWAVVSFKLKMIAFWDIVLCSLVGADRRFRVSYCLHRQKFEAHFNHIFYFPANVKNITKKKLYIPSIVSKDCSKWYSYPKCQCLSGPSA